MLRWDSRADGATVTVPEVVVTISLLWIKSHCCRRWMMIVLGHVAFAGTHAFEKTLFFIGEGGFA
jgi:hypothetical protein